MPVHFIFYILYSYFWNCSDCVSSKEYVILTSDTDKKMKNISIITIILFIINTLFVQVSLGAIKQQSLAVSNTKEEIRIASSNNDTSDNAESDDSFLNDLNNTNESSITTQIYKSTDPSDVIQDKSNIDSFIEEDSVLSKEDLLGRKNKNKNKIVNRKKKEDEPVPSPVNQTPILPWVFLIVLVSLLVVIFKFLFQKKI